MLGKLWSQGGAARKPSDMQRPFFIYHRNSVWSKNELVRFLHVVEQYKCTIWKEMRHKLNDEQTQLFQYLQLRKQVNTKTKDCLKILRVLFKV